MLTAYYEVFQDPYASVLLGERQRMSSTGYHAILCLALCQGQATAFQKSRQNFVTILFPATQTLTK